MATMNWSRFSRNNYERAPAPSFRLNFCSINTKQKAIMQSLLGSLKISASQKEFVKNCINLEHLTQSQRDKLNKIYIRVKCKPLKQKTI